LPASPEGPAPPPVVQRVRLRYTRRGRLRFTSHRDVARVLERALRRADVPIAFSAGFSPHPKISYLGACPTGVASEAEYLELGLSRVCEPRAVRVALDAALPPGIDVVEAAAVLPGEPALADRLDASAWRVRLPGTPTAVVAVALELFLAADRVPVARRTKDGSREVDARSAVVSARVSDFGPEEGGVSCATLDLVVRHATPTVRPDDVLAGLRNVAGLVPAAPPEATRQAQGLLAPDGTLADPLAPHPGLRSAATGGPTVARPGVTDFPVGEPEGMPDGPTTGPDPATRG